MLDTSVYWLFLISSSIFLLCMYTCLMVYSYIESDYFIYKLYSSFINHIQINCIANICNRCTNNLYKVNKLRYDRQNLHPRSTGKYLNNL